MFRESSKASPLYKKLRNLVKVLKLKIRVFDRAFAFSAANKNQNTITTLSFTNSIKNGEETRTNSESRTISLR